ncbi:calcium ATPase [Coemansia reversa NRRL 1564]|uniref:Calcium ATPase n=1 Tax=Coemansia reversa (strain ATCC 12441 / NRRL 1564) TaxID=763665 RepID=A0A2G5B5P1_COERN|nr:calcium ATPase [Coemansia reversa NRRL 1564]|eukprot:PIA14314.1 calcium ATPase [Coemansia reversa NRRL 1564]
MQGSFLNKRLTDDARAAYFLFGQFIEEVNEFQLCVGQKPTVDLRRALLLHKRLTDGGPEEERLALVTIIRLVLACMAPGHDWRDLVDEHEQRALAPVVEKYSRIIDEDTTSYHMPVTGGVVYPPPSLYFDRTVEKLTAMFKTDTVSGLTSEQVVERREFYGLNELPRPVRRPWWMIVWAQLTDLMILMLCAAIIATAVDGEWKSSIVLAVVVVLNTIIGAWQEIKAGKALSALENLGSTTAQVIRNGVLESIDASDLVPGDLVELNEGEAVPADLRLVFCAQLEIIESVLTGESIGVAKDPRAIKVRTRQLPLGDCKGNAFMSTMVSHGRGRGIVIRTGPKTEIGKISVAINRSSATVRKTPIQKKLTRLGLWLVVLALSLCAVIVICGVSWGRKFVPIFITGISLAVSVIPEGLVAVTTVTMALGVRRMARRNALVRTLPAVETLGGVTVICSDKTGTLTEGKMGMSELVDANGMLFEITRSTSRDPNEGEVSCRGHLSNVGDSQDTLSSSIYKHNTAAADISFIVCAMCNNAEVVPFRLLVENAFDSDRKRMSVVFEVAVNGTPPGKRCLVTLVKGAPEEILSVCTHQVANASGFMRSGSAIDGVPLTNSLTQVAGETCEKMAGRGLRVLGMAAKLSYVDIDQPVSDEELGMTWAESGLAFAGLVGLIDPPRSGIVESVERCHNAGIKVVMITGDHIGTATAIAESIGIIREDRPSTQRAISGAELDLLSDEATALLDPFPSVFARVSPENKVKIVRALQRGGHIVCMGGDGVNDSVSVKEADIGVAMGLGGTDITKQAADMVLMDDNFTTIVVAVEEGRRIFDNILKFIMYLLSCNSAEIILFLYAAVLNLDLPFTTIMILWANIIADIPPALSLGMDPPERNIMNRPPRNPKRGVLTRSTTLVLVIQAFFMATVTFAVFLAATNADENMSPHIAGARSIAFGVLTALQLNQAFLSRSVETSVFRTGLFANRWMVGCVLLSFGLYVLGVYVPGLNDWLELSPLGWQSWLVILGAVLLQVVFSELMKLVLRSVSRRRAMREQGQEQQFYDRN